MSKWSKKYWTDLAERVGATLVGAILSAVTVTGTTPVDWGDEKVLWGIIGVPTLVALLKGLLVNLGTGDTPTASLVKVTSNGEPDPPADQRGEASIAYVLVVCILVVVLVLVLARLL